MRFWHKVNTARPPTPVNGNERPSDFTAGDAPRALVQLRDLTKQYKTDDGSTVTAAAAVCLDIAAGQTVALVGPSGSGKSTLLHLIGALDQPDSGTLLVDGREITALTRKQLAAYRRTLGFVFQQYHLLPTLSALDNVLAPALPYRVDGALRARAASLLHDVGLGERARALPSRMSGGQQQRVAVARALLGQPKLLLADEPTGNLDTKTGAEIADLILSTRSTHATTVVLATHDLALAARCDIVVHVLDGHVQID